MIFWWFLMIFLLIFVGLFLGGIHRKCHRKRLCLSDWNPCVPESGDGWDFGDGNVMASWCSLPFYHGDLYHGIWDWIELTIKESNINCTCPIQLKHFRKDIQHEPCCLGLQYCCAKPVAGCLLGGLRRWHLATFAVLQRAYPERWGCSESVSCASMDTCEKEYVEYMMVAVTVIHTCDIFMRHYYCTWKMGRFWEAALDGMSA